MAIQVHPGSAQVQCDLHFSCIDLSTATITISHPCTVRVELLHVIVRPLPSLTVPCMIFLFQSHRNVRVRKTPLESNRIALPGFYGSDSGVEGGAVRVSRMAYLRGHEPSLGWGGTPGGHSWMRIRLAHGPANPLGAGDSMALLDSPVQPRH